jgi:preprotein translocase subunit SecG
VGIKDAFNFVQIVLAIVVIALVLLQAKGSGFTSMFGGDSTSVYRTRRGLEKRLFQVTIGISIAFFLLAFINSVWK